LDNILENMEVCLCMFGENHYHHMELESHAMDVSHGIIIEELCFHVSDMG
jgi:hypothetical protein